MDCSRGCGKANKYTYIHTYVHINIHAYTRTHTLFQNNFKKSGMARSGLKILQVDYNMELDNSTLMTGYCGQHK